MKSKELWYHVRITKNTDGSPHVFIGWLWVVVGLSVVTTLTVLISEAIV